MLRWMGLLGQMLLFAAGLLLLTVHPFNGILQLSLTIACILLFRLRLSDMVGNKPLSGRRRLAGGAVCAALIALYALVCVLSVGGALAGLPHVLLFETLSANPAVLFPLALYAVSAVCAVMMAVVMTLLLLKRKKAAALRSAEPGEGTIRAIDRRGPSASEENGRGS